jgi:hypothetical protein
MGREGAYHGRDERRQPQPTGEPSEERGRERVREEEEGEGGGFSSPRSWARGGGVAGPRARLPEGGARPGGAGLHAGARLGRADRFLLFFPLIILISF